MSFPDLFQFFLFETTRYLAPPAVAAEWILAALAALLIVWRWPGIPALCRAFRAVARRTRLAILLSALIPVALRLGLLTVIPVPVPSIHDEFSHLLLGDTLAHGRLANPPHPMWHYFESIHIIQQPTYASMYPPAQGAFLALGESVFHEPWAGVVVSVGLMCAALCWMFQGWLPPTWAFFGTILVILKFCIVGIWMNSYLGGSPSALGAALVIGALPRVRRTVPAVLFGVGLVLLMNSRPFEGTMLGLIALIYLFKQGSLRRVILPAGAVLMCGFAFTAYYNFRITGNALRMPYIVNRDIYGWPENLGFLPAKELAPLRHPVMEAMRQKELHNRDIYSSPEAFIDSLNTKLFDSWTFFLGPLLSIPLLLFPRVFRDRRTRPLAIFLAALIALNLLQMVLYPYHLGPAVPLMFAIVAQSVRHLYIALKRTNRKRALAFATLLPVSLVVLAAMKQSAQELRLPLAYWEAGAEPHRDPRADIADWLEKQKGGQLVIVRYGPLHNQNQEWVYNAADIDRSKVVWAREMSDNVPLLRYYPRRTKWLLEADVYPQRVVPYPAQP